MTDPDWLHVCNVDDVPMRGARIIQRANASAVAVFRTGSDCVFALLDKCPHKGGPLSQGIVHERSVTCPLHGLDICLDSGAAPSANEGSAPVFEVKRDGDGVYLRRVELATIGIDSTDDATGAA